MKRLIQYGLMFGNLVHVASPALVERYNRALEHLTGKRTALTDFYIDISGFSPEIGHELGDDLYLNHDGVNRQFILLTTEQKRSPLLNAKFSTSRAILRHFIEENEAQLFALTAKDAVAGELVNSVYHAALATRPLRHPQGDGGGRHDLWNGAAGRPARRDGRPLHERRRRVVRRRADRRDDRIGRRDRGRDAQPGASSSTWNSCRAITGRRISVRSTCSRTWSIGRSSRRATRRG